MAKRLWDKGNALDAQVQEFTIGTDPAVDQVLIPFDAMASAAHARMLGKIGILSDVEVSSLLDSLAQVVALHRVDSFDIPFELEDGHTAIENFLSEQCGEAGKKIHTGRSRNDQVLVALRLYMRTRLHELLSEVVGLAEVFLSRGREHCHDVMPGYTHFQRAMPTSYGVWFQAFAETLLLISRDGIELLQQLNCNPLGVASGFGVPLPLDREYTTSLLGFERTQRNPISVINSRGYFELRVLRWCTDVLACIEKFAADIVLFCSAEFGLISLPDTFTTGSSIMPQKRNPDVAELLRGRNAAVRAAATELEWVVAKLPSNYHRDHQYTKEPLCRGIAVATEAVEMCSSLAKAVEIKPERGKAALGPELLATYEAYRLVKSGISFRDAYQKAAKSFENGTLDIQVLSLELEQVLSSADKDMALCEKELKALENSLVESSKRFAEVLSSIFIT